VSRTLKKVDGDIFLQPSNGRALLISGNEKLAQDAADSLLTDYDPERGYGSRISSLELANSNRSVALIFNRGFIRQEVRDSLERLQSIQRQRSDQLTAFEAVGEIGTVRVYQASKTGFVFTVNIVPSGGLDRIPLSFRVNLRHQSLSSSKPGLPGSIRTDDTTII
tara:strand:- start:202 stop:696 length:495 start_codon:yes stop_codon:yes gene_type:complete